MNIKGDLEKLSSFVLVSIDVTIISKTKDISGKS